MLSTDEMEYSHTLYGKRPSNIPLPPAQKLFAIFQDLILEYFAMENTYRNFDVGKMLSTKSAKGARWKIKITHAKRYIESDKLFSNKNM